MSPNLEVQIPEELVAKDHITILLTPISDYSSVSSDSNDQNIDDYFLDTVEELPLIEDPTPIPLEQSFKDFLVKVTNTEDLSTLTQLKLRVISRDVTLQYLSMYTPALREIILDGSVVSSLRDLGEGLKNLKILKVNRCSLKCIDGVFGLENLEELYAADNEIRTLAPCAFLSQLKVLDVQRNCLTLENINFLKLCENIQELYIEGNPGIHMDIALRHHFQRLLSQLKIFNGIVLTDVLNENHDDNEGYILDQNNLNLNHPNHQQRMNFSVHFPPRVVLQHYLNNQ